MCELKVKTCRVCGFEGTSDLFQNKKNLCKKCRNNQAKKYYKTLKDYHIRNAIKKYSEYHNIEPDYSEDNMIKFRNSRQNLIELKKSKFRKCSKCEKILEKDMFRGNLEICKKCNNRLAYLKHLENNPSYIEQQSLRSKVRIKNHRNLLTDSFIKLSIRWSMDKSIRLSLKDIPQELIELKRKELILKRKIKSHGKEKAPN